VFEETLPVTISEPVSTVGTFKANEAVVANEAEVALLAVMSTKVMLLPKPSVRMLPEICTRSS
jgi:hypothetical protein